MPEAGKVAVEGKIASLFGGSLGIDPELTGRENIELRGLYLGLSKSEIRERIEEVIDFTELGPFIDMPFRSYSAGMRARLDFAISTSIEAEILLLDEGLGAGDASFIEKANRALEQLVGGRGDYRRRHSFGGAVAQDLHQGGPHGGWTHPCHRSGRRDAGALSRITWPA